ncbi:MAG: hypothetical protein WBE72_08360 [Terracidiphilus sp.]
MESVLRAWIEREPDLALSELSERLAKQVVLIKPGALWRQLNKWNLTFKKNLHASEQEREDVQQARPAWVEALPGMDVEKLAFIDETRTSTSMTRRCRRSPKGKRCLGSAPHGHWMTTAFAGALRRRRLTAPMVIEGPMEGELFSRLCARIPLSYLLELSSWGWFFALGGMEAALFPWITGLVSAGFHWLRCGLLVPCATGRAMLG